MRAIRRSLPVLFSLSLGVVPHAALAASLANAGSQRPAGIEFPNLSMPLDIEKNHFEAPVQTVTQERMTLPELRAFFDTLDRGAAVRLIYRNGSEYAGNYSGGDTGKPMIYCRKGVAGNEPVPLDAVTEAYVFVADNHLVRIRLPDGKHVRLKGSAPSYENTKAASDRAEREAIASALRPVPEQPKKAQAPTYDEWFNGRFWKEWVIGERNKHSERLSKLSSYKMYLGPAFGKLRLDEIGVEQIQQLRALLVEKKLADKSINNVMAHLSKSLRYAVEVELIEKMPRIRLRKVDRPEMQ